MIIESNENLKFQKKSDKGQKESKECKKEKDGKNKNKKLKQAMIMNPSIKITISNKKGG